MILKALIAADSSLVFVTGIRNEVAVARHYQDELHQFFLPQFSLLLIVSECCLHQCEKILYQQM
jgi:hypothetical protein